MTSPGMILAWADQTQSGVDAPEGEVAGFEDRVIEALSDHPDRFTDKWRNAGTVLFAVHAVCILRPDIACRMLRRMAELPGFEVEARTEKGLTPLVVCVYNRFAERVKIAQTLLDLGANPNSPADMKERPRGRVVTRKPALGHVFSMKAPLMANGMLPSRKTVDTDLAQCLIEAGAHCGAAYQSRPPIKCGEHMNQEWKRFGEGHCLPYQSCWRSFNRGHFWPSMSPEKQGSTSETWLHNLFRNYGEAPTVRLVSSYSNADLAAIDAGDASVEPSDYSLLISKPACAWDPAIMRELRTVLMCIHRVGSPLPITLWPVFISYFIAAPCAGFYDAQRLERQWGRRLSPYIDTGYVARQLPVRADVHAVCDAVAQSLHTDSILVHYSSSNGPSINLYPCTDADKCYEFADVACAIWGSTPSMKPSSYDAILARRLTFDSFEPYPISPEQRQQRLCNAFIDEQPEGAVRTVDGFAHFLVRATTTSAVRQLCSECRHLQDAEAVLNKVRSKVPVPLLLHEAESVVKQWFAQI